MSEPRYRGRTVKIQTTDLSPSQWNDSEVTGPRWPVPVYNGRSEAIHVFGDDTPGGGGAPDPVPACKCCQEQGDGSEPLGDCESFPAALVRADSWDNFGRTVTGTVVGKRVVTWGSGTLDGARSGLVAQLNRSGSIDDQVAAVTLSPWQSYWMTNGFGTKPVRADVSEIPIGYSASGVNNDPDPFIGWRDAPERVHFDWEARHCTAFRLRGTSFPANLTQCGFFGVDQTTTPKQIQVNRGSGASLLKESVLALAPGHIDAKGFAGGGGVSREIPVGVTSVVGDLSWTPSDGSPDFIVSVAGDREKGVGRNWIRTQDTVLDFNLVGAPTEILDRYPLERYSVNLFWTDILGGIHHGWGSNDARDSVNISPGTGLGGVPRYTMYWDEAAGWGTGDHCVYDFASANGDDWSQSAYVAGGYGVLNVPASPITGVPGYASVDAADRFFGPYDTTFTVRFANPMTPATPYNTGWFVSLLDGFFLYPANEILDIFGASLDLTSLDLDWSQDVMFRIQRNTTGSRLKIWRASSAEPGSWLFQNAGSTWGPSNSFWPTWQMEAPNSSSSQILYVGPGVDPNPSGDISCTECEDPDNPGVQIPPFTPGYLPIFRKQIGDPTTDLDAFICTLEAGAMLLDWHTRGAVQVWGGELIPWTGSPASSIYGSGANLDELRRSWLHWNQNLSVRSGQTWNDLINCLEEGRGAVIQGDYDEFNLAERCQNDFLGDHAILMLPYQQADRILCGDPLCNDFRGIARSTLQAYVENFGRAVFGVTSPQRILFAVSRPWTP